MVDSETYIERWDSHIGELERLKFNLHPEDHADEREQLDEVKDELKDIVEVAAESDY